MSKIIKKEKTFFDGESVIDDYLVIEETEVKRGKAFFWVFVNKGEYVFKMSYHQREQASVAALNLLFKEEFALHHFIKVEEDSIYYAMYRICEINPIAVPDYSFFNKLIA